MLLTIHNLPTNTTYSDVKALIWNKCGLQEMIVDQLVNDGAGKKVTIGLADEGDAAILVRKINGLFINGQHLYVEDIRKQRASDQPYGKIAKPADNTRPYYNEYQDIQGQNPMSNYDSTMLSQNMIMMGLQPVMQDYNNMPAIGMYHGETDQNSTIMGYNNRNQSSVSMVTQHPKNSYHEPVYGYQPQMVEDNFQGNNRSQGYQPPMAQDKFQSNNRSQGYQPQMVEDNFHGSNRSQSYQPQMVNDKYQDNTRSHGYQPQMVEDKFLDNDMSQGYQSQMIENKFQGNDRSKPNQARSSRRETQRRRSPTSYQNKPVRQNARGHYQQSNQTFDIAYPKRESSRNAIQNFEQLRPQRGDFEASVSNDDYYRGKKLDDNRKSFELCEAQVYGNHVTGAQESAPNSRNLESKRDFSDSYRARDSFGPENVSNTGNRPYQSQYPNPKMVALRTQSNGRSKPFPELKQIQKKPESKPGSHQVNKKYFVSDNKAPNFGAKRTFQSQKPESKIFGPGANKFFNERKASGEKKAIKPFEHTAAHAKKRPHDAATFKSEPQNKKFIASREDSRIRPKKTRAPEELTASQLISRDKTWRNQAASDIAKTMIKNFKKGVTNPKDDPIFYELKSSIRSRIDVVLAEKFSVPLLEIIKLYSKRFNPENDKSFFDAILEKVNSSTEVQSEKPEDSTSVSHKVTTNANKAAAVGPSTGKAAMKEQKKISKAEFQGDKVYTLPPDLHKALEDEMETISGFCVTEYEDCEDDKEKVVCGKIVDKAIPELKRLVTLNIKKRLLNVTTGLLLRIIGIPKPPTKATLELFLRDYGYVDLRKSEKKNLYIVKIDTYENYDKLCALKSTVLGGITVQFEPINVAGPPDKPTKQEIKDQRAQWIENQIDINIKTDIEYQSKGKDGTIDQEDAKKILNDQAINNSDQKSIENTGDKEIKIECEKENSENIDEFIDEELNKIENILNATEKQTEADKVEDLENVKIDELLDVDLDDDDLEDY